MMVLNTEWTQLEIVELLNELPSQNLDDISSSTAGNGGFGFGITGNKSTGVVVKVITQGGSAAKDGRLKINDQLFQIGNINVRGMNSEQVAAVLRQSAFHGQHVKFLVARPVHNSASGAQLADSNEIIDLNQEKTNNDIFDIDLPMSKSQCFLIKTSTIVDKRINFKNLITLQNPSVDSEQCDLEQVANIVHHPEHLGHDNGNKSDGSKRMDRLELEPKEILVGNDYTVEIGANYNFDRAQSNLVEYVNKELNRIGIWIEKKEENYFIQAIDALKNKLQVPEVNDQLVEINQIEMGRLHNSNLDLLGEQLICFKFCKNFELKAELLGQKWRELLANEQHNSSEHGAHLPSCHLQIIVSRIDKTKSKNIGISLEGTVDLDDDGIEKFPRHYIRSIMPNGPVDSAKDTPFAIGDQLLEIDSIKLYAISYVQLLEHLKNLKSKQMILVCARFSHNQTNCCNVKGELFNLHFAQNCDRADKSESDVVDKDKCIDDQKSPKAATKVQVDTNEMRTPKEHNHNWAEHKHNQLCIRSRSLELSGLTLWNKKIVYINLIKEQKGLGFSLIDYQSDSYNPLSKTVIVIRALVPGGVAHLDARLMPGQRLVSVNDHILDDAFILNDGNDIHHTKYALSSSCSRIFHIDLLSYAVDMLKNLPIGKVVRLGIQKPLPYPDAQMSSVPSQDEDFSLCNQLCDVKPQQNDTESRTKQRRHHSHQIEINLESNSELSDAHVKSLNNICAPDKKMKHENKYGIAATSAPAILTHVQTDCDNIFTFYSSTSQLKLNTLTLYNQKFRSNSSLYPNDTISKCHSCRNDLNDPACFSTKVKSLDENSNSCLWSKKDRSVSVSFPLNTLPNQLNAKHHIISRRPNFSHSIKFLDKLLLNDKQNESENIRIESSQQLINENQFHLAFVRNVNKKSSLFRETQNERIDAEMLEIEATLKNQIFKGTSNDCEVSDLDLLNMKTENCNESSFSGSSSVLNKIIYKMASHSWPKTIPKLVTTNFSHVKKLFDSNNLKNSRPNMNRKRRTFEEQIIAINQSRSPSGARFFTKFADSNRFRSKSQGSYVRTGNLAIKNNTLSKTNSSSSHNIKIISILGKEIIRLPCYLEREIRIKKNFYPLGIVSVDCCVDEGINGCIIKKIESNSACAKDGRLKVGDYLLSVNNEQMRILSNSSARAILNRASLTSKDVVVIYIPHESAFKLKKNVIKFEKAQSDFQLLTTLSSSPVKSFRAASVSTSSRSLSTSSSLSNSSVSKSSYSAKSLSLESLCSFSNQHDDSEIICESEHQRKRLNGKARSCKHQNMKKSDDKKDGQLQNQNNDQLNQDLSYEANFGTKLNKDCQNKQNIERLRISVLDGRTFDEVKQVNSIDQSDLSQSLWGPQRMVILEREENQSLGISIVGGKLDVSTQKGCDVQLNFISGIFVKHVQAKSPAGISGLLKTGDRILAVNDIDLTQASHDQAVVVIKNAKSPVKFLIQSLICVDSQVELGGESYGKTSQETHDDKNDFSQDNSKQIFTQPNKYNYSLESIKEKYSYFLEPKENENESNLNCEEKNELFIFRLEKSFANQSLGLCLSGNVNLTKTSVFVCAIYPNSIAQSHGLIKIGDQILEINGQLIYGRAHSNVTPFIKSIKDLQVYMVIYRNAENLNQMFKPANNYLADFKYQRVGEEGAAEACASQCDHYVTLESLSNSASQRSSISADYSESLLSSSSQNNHLTELNSTKTRSCLNTQKIMLKKASNGFGIAISEDKNERLIVRGLNSNGIAFQDGRLQVGDEILAVNNIKVNTMKYDDIMNLLQTTDEPVEFEVAKKEALHKMQGEMQTAQGHMKYVKQNSQIDRQRFNSQSHEEKVITSQSIDFTTSQSNKSKNVQSSFETNSYLQCCKIENKKNNPNLNECSSQITNDEPKTNSIKVGCETWIEIDRKKTGLGLSIIGGCDTQLPGIIINDIYQNGAAFNDNRLLIGDQIIKVNNIDLISATHDQALNALRQTSDCVRLLIHRSFSNNDKNVHTSNSQHFESFSNQDNEKFMHIITVELNKKFGKGLGFSIIGRREGSGVFISHIIDGGCADRDGRLTVGDLILEVNGQDIRKSAYNDVAFLLKTLPQGKVTLKIGRFKTSTNRQNSTRASLNGSKINSTRNSNLDLDNLENSIVSNDISNFKPCKKK